jgi:flagellar protein FlaF
MNTAALAQTAYTAIRPQIGTDRDTEYDTFARVTHEIRTAAERGAGGFAALAAALNRNRRLWTILAADIADPGNGLPQPLRAGLFYLAEFTDHHTRQVLAGTAGPEALIDINTAVMRGLRGETGTAT